MNAGWRGNIWPGSPTDPYITSVFLRILILFISLKKRKINSSNGNYSDNSLSVISPSRCFTNHVLLQFQKWI